MNIGAGDTVTIMSMHIPEAVYLIYALNYIGAVANMVYPTLNEGELLETIQNTESKAFFILDVLIEKIVNVADRISIPCIILPVDGAMPTIIKLGYRLKKARKKVAIKDVINFKKFLEMGSNNEICAPSTDSDLPAVITYTSGTTGVPKGVVLSSDNLNDYAEQDYAGLLEFTRGKDSLFILPPFTAVGIAHLHVQINAGIKTIIHIDLDAESINKSLFKYKPYCFMTGPVLIDSFLSQTPKDLHELKYFINGGGGISDEKVIQVIDHLKKCNAEASFSNGYGMTESVSALCLGANEIYKIGSVGIPFIGTNIKVIDVDSGKELKYGETGELIFSSPNLMKGYYKNDEATDKVIIVDEDGQKWLRTGDLGFIDEDGFVFLKGRLKRIFITRAKDNVAYKLFPQRVEEVLLEHGEVLKCGVTVRKDEKRIHVGIAYVQPKDCKKYKTDDEKEALKKELIKYTKAELPEHMVPTDIIVMDNIPSTASGKIDYRALEEN
jgi:long-chain acyl-CoA synthetase